MNQFELVINPKFFYLFRFGIFQSHRTEPKLPKHRNFGIFGSVRSSTDSNYKFIQSKNRRKRVSNRKTSSAKGWNFEPNWYLKTLISEKIEALQSIIIMQQITDIYIYHKKNKVIAKPEELRKSEIQAFMAPPAFNHKKVL